MAAKALPSPEYLRQRLRYDPDTGKLYWREHVSMSAQWNGRYAGREAFTARKQGGYRVGAVDGANMLAHRVVWALWHGSWPDEQIDHLDHDPGNNQVHNLRDASQIENGRNLPRSKANTSGATGVVWCRQTNLWRAQITVSGRGIALGRFDSFDDAVAARKAAEARYGFHDNHGVEAAHSIEVIT